MKRLLPSLLVTTLCLAACAPMGGRGPERGGDGGPPRGESEERGSGASVVANLQERLRQTAEALALTPTQWPLWDRYQEKIGALMADQLKLESWQPRQSAPQQIGRKVDTVRNRLAAMEDVQEAAARLYAVLDEQQKRTADQMLAATVPALYSGLSGSGNERNESRGGGRGGLGGGMGGLGGGMGGGFGR